MNQIYTSNGSLIVEQVIWSGVHKAIKHADGKVEIFYRTNDEKKFRKTGWGKRAARDFESFFAKVKAQLEA